MHNENPINEEETKQLAKEFLRSIDSVENLN